MDLLALEYDARLRLSAEQASHRSVLNVLNSRMDLLALEYSV